MSILPEALSLGASIALGVWSFSAIVRGYRRPGRIPWLASLLFAAAAAAALFLLRSLLAG